MNIKMFIYIILCIPVLIKAGEGGEIYHIPPISPTVGNAVSFEATVSSDVIIVEAVFIFKMKHQPSYSEIEMEFLGNTWVATILKVPEGDEIEYFFKFIQQDGSEIIFSNNNPYMLSILSTAKSDSNNNFEVNNALQNENNFLLISPNENDIIYSDAMLIMVSFYNISDIDLSSVRLYLDDKDVTTGALITSDIITYAPKHVTSGLIIFTLTATTNNGEKVTPIQSTISVVHSEDDNSIFKNFKYSINGTSGLSSDKIDDEKLNIGMNDLFIRGGWPWLQFKSNVKITTEEDPFKQPKNRYSTMIDVGKFLDINLGDFTPSLSPYTIDGKRIRGTGAELRLGWLQLQFVQGELERAIQGNNETDKTYRVSDIFLNDSNKIIYKFDRRGYTFKNNLSSYRLALNIREKIIFGSTVLLIKNDIKSVDIELPDASLTISPDTNLSTSIHQLDTIITFSEFQKFVEQNNNNYDYQLEEVGWGGRKPKQNLVLGTDFRFALDEEKFLLEGYWAISLLNKDIWDGALTLVQLDTLMGDPLDGQILGKVDTTSVPDPAELEDYMTINMNMVPLLPVDYALAQSGNLAKAFLNLPSGIYHLKFRSLYFNNLFQLQYSQVGPEFSSLANPYFPKNTREYSIIDKIWLLNRTLQSTFSYKFKTNNLLETNTNPYDENTYGINLNYIPGYKLPTTMYSHQSIVKTNSKTDIDTLLTTIDDSAPDWADWDTTYSLQDSRIDFTTKNHLVTINVPINHQDDSYWIGGTINLITGKDQLENARPPDFLSQASTMRLISLVFGARYEKGLKLILNISNLRNNHAEQGISKLNGLSITGGYPVYNDKINLSGTLSYLSSSGLSEFSNYRLLLGSKIKISKNFRLNLAASTKARSSSSGTEISGITIKLSTNYMF